jgi:MFS family permease
MTQEIKQRKLFVGSCVALLVGGMVFAVLSAIMNPLKQQFLLTNAQAGWIGGAGLWGFPISILIFGPLCSVLGIKFLLRLAFSVHIIGALLMIFATNFWMLFFGALTIAFGNGLVEGACNPLVATLFLTRKQRS